MSAHTVFRSSALALALAASLLLTGCGEDAAVSRLKLEGNGLRIDTLTPEQEAYLKGWEV